MGPHIPRRERQKLRMSMTYMSEIGSGRVGELGCMRACCPLGQFLCASYGQLDVSGSNGWYPGSVPTGQFRVFR